MKKEKNTSPLLGEKILRLFASEKERETLIGDIEEWLDKLKTSKGVTYAKLWYWSQIIKSILVYLYVSFYWRNIMLKNYVKNVIRKNIKHPQ